MGKTFNKIVRMLVIGGFSDTQCGFKLLKGEIAGRRFGEAKIGSSHMTSKFSPSPGKKDAGSRRCRSGGSILPSHGWDPVKDSLRMLADLFRIRLAVGKVKGRGS